MYSDRINALPPYLFAAIDEARDELIARGVDVIDLGVGDPDMPTHPHIVEAMREAVCDPKTHQYPSYARTGVRNIKELSSTLPQKCFP